MAIPRSKESRRFFRAASCRFEEAQFLIDKGHFTTGAVYLAGYAVECMLKALILSNEVPEQNKTTLATFKGQSGHSFEGLKEQLSRRKVFLPPEVSVELMELNWWTTSLRYDPSTIRLTDAEAFFKSTKSILHWAEGRL